MSNAINANNNGLKVNVGLSVQRQTPKTDFGSMVGRGLNTAADVAIQGTNIAAAFIPGGSVVSAAVSGLGQLKNSSMAHAANARTLGTGNHINSNGTGLGGTSAPMTGGAGAFGGAGAAGNVDPNIAAQRDMMEMNQSFNMQYLGLQQEMQAENRKFTALSNIMKTRHDTAKNAISNVR